MPSVVRFALRCRDEDGCPSVATSGLEGLNALEEIARRRGIVVPRPLVRPLPRQPNATGAAAVSPPRHAH